MAYFSEGKCTFPVPVQMPSLSLMVLHCMLMLFYPPQYLSTFMVSVEIWLSPEMDQISTSLAVIVPCDFPNMMMLRKFTISLLISMLPDVINFCDLKCRLLILPLCTVREGTEMVPCKFVKVISSDLRSPSCIDRFSPTTSREKGFDLIFLPTAPEP